MWKHSATMTAMALAGSLALAPLTGCEELPGGKKEQAAVIGGLGGAAAGAVVADDNRVLGALIGGALGAGGGYLIGAQMEKTDGDDNDRQEAAAAVEEAQANPATADEARQATTADLNNDGFVTADEVIAMSKAGLNDEEILRRLRATNQVFELTSDQEQFLIANGVSRNVVDGMQDINRDLREDILRQRGEVLGKPV